MTTYSYEIMRAFEYGLDAAVAIESACVEPALVFVGSRTLPGRSFCGVMGGIEIGEESASKKKTARAAMPKADARTR